MTRYIALIKKYYYEQNLVYYQILLIDSLTKQIMNEDHLNKALKVSQMTTTAFERKLHTDRLSGIKNRTFYEEQLDKKWQVTNYTFVIFDIDRFKMVNDTYGHLVGDQAINWLTSLAVQWKPKQNIDVIRYGGDEFILLIPHRLKVIQEDLEVLRKFVMSKEFVIRETGESIHMIISIVACYTNDEMCTLKQLFKQADVALYQAKENDRNRLYVQEYKKETLKML